MILYFRRSPHCYSSYPFGYNHDAELVKFDEISGQDLRTIDFKMAHAPNGLHAIWIS